MPNSSLQRAADGYFHPANEADVIALVDFARANAVQVRARGASHSVALSIFTDPVGGKPENKTLEQVPPQGPNIDIALDRMNALTWIDEANGVVEVEAGCHLGRNPNDPFGASTLENSFLHQIFLKGWAVDSLGGITHQTVSGFSATGSAGGSVRHTFDNVIAYRVVDGNGQASWIEQGDPEFPAMLTHVGLLGIVTALRFQLSRMYNILGTETTTTTGADCPIDLFGPGDEARPSLQKFLTDTPYSRITWWPQKGCERVQIWQAERVGASCENLKPYQEFTPTLMGQIDQLMASLFFILLGNTGLTRIFALLLRNLNQFHGNLAGLWSVSALGGAGALVATAVLGLVVSLLALVLGIVPGTVQRLFTTMLPLFNPLTGKKGPTKFFDWYWRSLCMDNTADDVLLATEFNEIWVPIQHAGRVMGLFQGMFDRHGSKATGWFALEVYAGGPSPAWIHPGYSDGSDEYKDGTARFDVYWARDNLGAPNLAHAFYTQYWKLLRDNGIPFRFHWGKFIPFFDFPDWATYYGENLPCLGDFLALRAKRDPQNIFFTEYWQLRLLGRTLEG